MRYAIQCLNTKMYYSGYYDGDHQFRFSLRNAYTFSSEKAANAAIVNNELGNNLKAVVVTW